jgi:methylmalonyl-CoA mutase cobalamin-binding subunit
MKPSLFEEMFGVGENDASAESKHRPIVPTDVFHRWRNEEEKIKNYFRIPAHKKLLEGKKILLASTDVHEHALFMIRRVLSDVLVDVVDLGAEVDPDVITREAKENKVDAVMVSTHNGMALEYCKELKVEMLHNDLVLPVIVGGVLNQKFEEQEMPVDVTEEIGKMGFFPCIKLEDMIKIFEGNQ